MLMDFCDTTSVDKPLPRSTWCVVHSQHVFQRSFKALLFVAFSTFGWAGFHFLVAIDAELVGLILVEASYLAASCIFMAELAVLKFVHVYLVIERNLSH
jgi:hypothetical protein